ncbi:MAG TPA: hypothetical protein VIH99_03750 [Bdellovibrionota bacterium]|jgi:hypothetical protein
MGNLRTVLLAFAAMLLVAAFAYLGARALQKYRVEEAQRIYTRVAQKINGEPSREWCDDHTGKYRLYASQVVDRFRDDIKALWSGRKGEGEPKFGLLDLGVIKLRINPKAAPGKGFDSSAWSWDEAYGLIRKTQVDPEQPENVERWRDVDSMVRFLLEKDYARVVLKRKFLPPEKTPHQFRPTAAVRRTGPREFTVLLDPGELRGHEEPLRRLLETEWQGGGYHLKVNWSGTAVYRLRTHRNSSRSYVHHGSHSMEIAHLAWTKTVAHELGHVLGFDDHYYNVWNARNCYYTQESRLGDIMSNSERGAITLRHWELLDKAYPWKAEPLREPFSYLFE